MSKSKGRKLAEWLRDLDENSKPSSNSIKAGSIETAKIQDLAVTFGKLHSDTVITSTETVGSNDSDTALPTAAAVIDYVGLRAPLASPTFTGTPAAPTASAGTNTTQLATTAFVTTAVAGASTAGISSSADATAITITSNERVTIDPAGSSQNTHELSVREQDSPRITIDDIGGDDTSVNAALLFRAGTTNKAVVGMIGQDDFYVENKTAAGSVILATNDIDRLTIDSSGTLKVGGTAAGLIELNGPSSGNEGGQLNIVTAGSLGTYSIDAYEDDMRFLNGTTAGNYRWYKNSNAGHAMTLSGAGDLALYGKLTITDSDYDNHLELNRSSEQWRFSPSTDGSLDIRRIAGTGTARVDFQNDIDVDGGCTATAFYGDGSNLTGISPSNMMTTDTIQNITNHKEFQDDIELRFGNSANVRMEYRSTGDFYCRSYQHGGRLLFQGENSSGTNKALVYMDPDGECSLYHTGSKKGYTYSSGWRVTGNLLATSDVTAYYSDERLKIKQGKIENALEKVNSIETFYFTNNELAKSFGYKGDELQVGVSAQSVEKVMPEVIHLAPIDDDGEGNSVSGEDYKTVQYDRLVPLLIESIKELKAEIEELKKGR